MFRPAVDVRVSEPLRDELSWLAGSLGGVRDQRVVRERLTALAARDGEAAGLLLAQLRRPEPLPSDAVLGSPRYADLLAGLDGFVSEPGGRPARRTTPGPSYDAASARSGTGSPSGRPSSSTTQRGSCPTSRSTTYARRPSDCATAWRSRSCSGAGNPSGFAGRSISSPTSSVNARTSPSPGRSCSSWRRGPRLRASRPSSTVASTGSRSRGPWSWRHSSTGSGPRPWPVVNTGRDNHPDAQGEGREQVAVADEVVERDSTRTRDGRRSPATRSGGPRTQRPTRRPPTGCAPTARVRPAPPTPSGVTTRRARRSAWPTPPDRCRARGRRRATGGRRAAAPRARAAPRLRATEEWAARRRAAG